MVKVRLVLVEVTATSNKNNFEALCCTCFKGILLFSNILAQQIEPGGVLDLCFINQIKSTTIRKGWDRPTWIWVIGKLVVLWWSVLPWIQESLKWMKKCLWLTRIGSLCQGNPPDVHICSMYCPTYYFHGHGSSGAKTCGDSTGAHVGGSSGDASASKSAADLYW